MEEEDDPRSGSLEDDDMTSDHDQLLRHRQGIYPKKEQANVHSDDIDDDDDDESRTALTKAQMAKHNNNSNKISSEGSSPSASSFLTPVVWCILISETAERFAYFGFRAILVLYLTTELEYTESAAIAVYAYNSSLAYFTPLLGAYLADGYWGRYRTILTFGCVYVLGLAVLATTAAYYSSSFSDSDTNTDLDSPFLTWKRICSFAGLFLVCLGTGGIKPCVSAFGADQVSFAAAHHQDPHPCRSSNGDRNDTDINERDVCTRTSDSDADDNNCIRTTNGDKPIVVVALVDPRETAVIGNDCLQQEPQEGSDQVRAFFNYFYFCINVGALASIAIVPLFREKAGFGWAFGVPCLFMMAALALFFSKRHEYVHHQHLKVNHSNSSNNINNNHSSGNSNQLMTTFRITWWLLLRRIYAVSPWIADNFPCFRPGPIAPFPTVSDYPWAALGNERPNVAENDSDAGKTKEQKQQQQQLYVAVDDDDDALRKQQQLDDAAQALHVLPVLAMFPIFWCLYDQQGSVWTLQATRMRLPSGLQPEQLNIVNPLQIMIFIPLFDRVIYPYLENQRRWDISPLRRMSCGMLFTALAFFVSGLVESSIQRNEKQGFHKVHVFWQLPQITILAVAEILLSVTGLEFAYATSPDRLKAFVTALFLSTTGIGDCFSGVLYSTVFAHMNRAVVMHVCAVVMLGNLRLFIWVAKWYERHEFQAVNHDERRILNDGMELQKFQGEVA